MSSSLQALYVKYLIWIIQLVYMVILKNDVGQVETKEGFLKHIVSDITLQPMEELREVLFQVSNK